jgi:hypothetical protein
VIKEYFGRSSEESEGRRIRVHADTAIVEQQDSVENMLIDRTEFLAADIPSPNM